MTSDNSGCNASFDTMLSFSASRKVMKFSVAAKMRLPDAPADPVAVGILGAEAPCEACSTVAGRPIRNRSVARGHSNCIWCIHVRGLDICGVRRDSMLTPHVRLKVSRSTNSRTTASSPRLDLYCFKSLVQVSVYSASVTTSLMYAFSSPSRVTTML